MINFILNVHILLTLFLQVNYVISEFSACPSKNNPNSYEIRYIINYISNGKIYEHEINSFQISKMKYNKNCNFVFITHGLTQKSDEPWTLQMRDEFLKNGCFNIIRIDWSSFTTTTKYSKLFFGLKPIDILIDTLRYIKSVAWDTCNFGEYIAINLIKPLHDIFGIKYENMHFIGHSLGAHLCGCMAKKIYRLENTKIGRITGLDPAGPLFKKYMDSKCRLDLYDATFIDCIHTDLFMGYVSPGLCTADFYPNGGSNQPGCLTAGLECDHLFATILFYSSINTPGLLAQECSDYTKYICGKCKDSPPIEMGYNVDKNATGQYYLQTRAYGNPPYSKYGEIETAHFLLNSGLTMAGVQTYIGALINYFYFKPVNYELCTKLYYDNKNDSISFL